ncbi:rCG32030 [Rattus norvegicus]|uniref:RCG32030 n=1 Tax=Rattus norvegicus TaxID=10116 RepID=A6KS65_RAT|nr:rCG32030 [Rattus norvegicus]
MMLENSPGPCLPRYQFPKHGLTSHLEEEAPQATEEDSDAVMWRSPERRPEELVPGQSFPCRGTSHRAGMEDLPVDNF